MDLTPLHMVTGNRMANLDRFDIAVIGGGIIGTATALKLSDRCKGGKLKLILLESEDGLARHQTGNNSGVIHSGLYYRPGSMKARNCTRGRESLIRFCQEHDIPHKRCGKVVIASREVELPALEKLRERGIANGLTGIQRLRPEEIKEHEPAASGLAGLFVPQTGIVNYTTVCCKFGEIFQKNGGDIRLNSRVVGVRRCGKEIVLQTTSDEVICSHLINCSGLHSDRVARMAGIDPGLMIVPFRGEYHTLIPTREHLVKNLIYPVPDPQFPFLGVHFTRMIEGGVEAGPNAVLAGKREGYKAWQVSPRDAWATVTYPGFWRMARKHWRMGLVEQLRSMSKAAFVRALKRLIPEIESGDIRRGGAGVRAQALERTGFLVDDFRIQESERMIHVLNAPSPAATASLEIAETITGIAVARFQLDVP